MGSNVYSGVRCHVSTSRCGGSHSVTKPHSHSAPSASRSNQRPPARGSIATSTAIVSPMWWLSIGDQVLKPAVNTSKARSGDACTVTLRLTEVRVASVIDPPSRPPS